MRQRPAKLCKVCDRGGIEPGARTVCGRLDEWERKREREIKDVGLEESDGACVSVAVQIVAQFDELLAEVAREDVRRCIAVLDEFADV